MMTNCIYVMLFIKIFDYFLKNRDRLLQLLHACKNDRVKDQAEGGGVFSD